MNAFPRRRPLAVAVICLLTATAAAEDSPESNFLSNLRQVTDGFVRAGEGYFSPDGRTIVYQAVTADYPFYQIFAQPLDGGTPRRVSTGRGRTTCAYFSPDGKKILFASSHLDPNLDAVEAAERRQLEEDRRTGRRRRYEWPFDPQSDLFDVAADGGELHRLTEAPGYDAEGSYSPDGRRIVFCSTRDGDPNLYVMNADGGDVRQLTDAPGYDGGPFFSPDGRWICYRTDRRKKEHLQIHVLRTDGGGDTALTDDENSVHWAPYWHPTAPYLIWTGADHSNPDARPNYDLWLMKYEIVGDEFRPGRVRRVTDHPSGDVLPVFSPDGRRLMWTSGRSADRASQLWIADFQLPE